MRKKLYTLICAGLIMAASVLTVYAAEVECLNGVEVEEADYNITRLVDENTSEGIAQGIDPRGSIIDTAMTSISNLGKGDIGIFIQTFAHVECDKIKNVAVFNNAWKIMINGLRFLDIYTMLVKKIFPTEPLVGMTNDLQ